MKVHDVDEMMQRMLFGTWLGASVVNGTISEWSLCM